MRYSLRHLLVGVTVLSLLVGATIWYNQWPKVIIQGSDLAKEQIVELTTNRESKDVLGLTIRVSGKLDGTATLILPWDDTQLVLGPGIISEYRPHDFYDAEANVRYLPGTAKRGRVVLKYDFW
jgi:hypothetical protein